MINLYRFIISFISVYLIISLPTMFSVGYVIDWVPEATWFYIIKGYVLTGLLIYAPLKLIVSLLISSIITLLLKKQYTNSI